MSTPEQPDQPTPQKSEAMRSEVRLHTPGLDCSMGRVADITGSGMRLIFPKGKLPEIGDVQTYTFDDGENTLEVTGSVKWIRRGSAFARQAEAGVEFCKIDQGQRDSLIRLAVQGKLRESKASYVRIAQTDLYKLLGVTRYASAEQIDQAFNERSNEWGNEDTQHPQAAQRLDEILKAYSVLSDPDKRAQYDTRFADQHDRAA